MIVGERSRFAIEYELDKEYGGVWLYGKMCFWINDTCVGDYELGTSLRDVLFAMKNIVSDSGNRINPNLFLLNTEELFNRLDITLYGCEVSPYEQVANEEIWARLDANILVDIFNDWKVYIIENDEKARVIVGRLVSECKYSVFETELKPNEFDKVVFVVYKELERRYESELDKENLL